MNGAWSIIKRLQLTIKYLVQQEQGESGVDVGWISCGSIQGLKR